ncbi:MAG: EAL and HDOD domain-containing protein, partial [Pseudomonadales bacterium]
MNSLTQNTNIQTDSETHDLSQVLFAQQPILDVNQELVAYELLFRGDFDRVDGAQASAQVLLNAFDQGLFRESHSAPLFINFTESLLFNPPPFDKESFVIELLETIEPSEAIYQQVAYLKEQGYTIALDDFINSDAMIPLLHLADIVKVDVMDTPMEDLAGLVEYLRKYDVRLLAEKVEDHAMFDYCLELGFEWFQGYFFARPKHIQGRAIGPNKSAVLAMVAALQQADLEASTLDGIVSSDSGLTYKVLRLANSAYLRRAAKIESISHAVVMLGIGRLQNFASLIAISELGQKPEELQTYATYRGLLCERLGAKMGSEHGAEVFQAAGILSCCDAYFDAPLDELIPKLPLSEALVDALLKRQGD